MIIKVCQFRARREQGERLVEVFHPGEMEKAAAFFDMEKQGAPLLPEVQRYLAGLKPHPNKIYTLVNALGAGEYWGSNINGDYFPEGSLIHTGPVYGYETFYQAHPYKHHVNKDPSKTFGRVELSVWHDGMKRVELVVSIDRFLAEKFGAQDICDKLDHGMYPDVSMGCKVPYDLCSHCTDWEKYRAAQATYDPSRHKSVGMAVLEFHKKNSIRGLSVTRNDYCSHLKNQLNKILGDGTKLYAINDFPRFFDISFVFIGADKTAKVMAKLASVDSGDCIPSWYVAEQMGYDLAAMDKEFEKAAFRSTFGAGPALRDFVRGARQKYHPDELTLKRAVGYVKKGKELAVEHSPEERPTIEKEAGVAQVRALLREKKASHRKGAEITKEVTPSQFGGKAVPADQKTPDLPNEVLDLLGQSPLHEALSTPTTMGMILRPREFQRITIISIGRKDLADKMDEDGLVFPPVGGKDETIPMGGEHFSETIKKLLLPFMEDRSNLEPVAKRRLIRIQISGGPADKQPTPDAKTKTAAETPFLQKISAAYNSYLDRVANCLGHAAEAVNNHSDMWEAVFRSGLVDGFEKEAAGEKVNPAVVLGAIGGGWALSARAKRQRNLAMMGAREPVGPITDIMAEYPGVLMFLAGLGALHQQGSSIPRRLVGSLTGFAKDPLGPKE